MENPRTVPLMVSMDSFNCCVGAKLILFSIACGLLFYVSTLINRTGVRGYFEPFLKTGLNGITRYGKVAV